MYRFVFISSIYTLRVGESHKFRCSLWNSYNKSYNNYNQRYLAWRAYDRAPVANNTDGCHHEVKTIEEIEANDELIFADDSVSVDLMSSLQTQAIVILIFNELYQ